MPATPATFAALASSLPRRGSCEPSLSVFLEPSFPANPESGTANTLEPDERELRTISESQFSNS